MNSVAPNFNEGEEVSLPSLEGPREVEWVVEVMRTNDSSLVAQERGVMDLCRLTVHTEGLIGAAESGAGVVVCRALQSFRESEKLQRWGTAAISALCAVPTAAEEVPKHLFNRLLFHFRFFDPSTATLDCFV